MCWCSSFIIISWMWLWLKSISNKKEESKCMGAFLQKERITVSHGQCIHTQWILRDPLDCSLPGSSVHGTLQARILEWVAISFSREFSWPRDQTHVSWVSYIGRWILYHCTTWEDPASYRPLLISTVLDWNLLNEEPDIGLITRSLFGKWS